MLCDGIAYISCVTRTIWQHTETKRDTHTQDRVCVCGELSVNRGELCVNRVELNSVYIAVNSV